MTEIVEGYHWAMWKGNFPLSQHPISLDDNRISILLSHETQAGLSAIEVAGWDGPQSFFIVLEIYSVVVLAVEFVRMPAAVIALQRPTRTNHDMKHWLSFSQLGPNNIFLKVPRHCNCWTLDNFNLLREF